ncbi:4709_t:CDS:2, partial [Paraglomus brasilianum]
TLPPTSDDDTNPWIIHQPRHRKRAPPNSRNGHIAVHCPQQVPKRTSCQTICTETALKIFVIPVEQLDILPLTVLLEPLRNRTEFANVDKPNRPEDLQVLNNQFVCRGCVSDYYYELPLDDLQRIYYYSHGEECGTLVQCKICGETRPTSKMNNLESLEQALWFCDLEHLYAYKAGQDVLYNANYNLWTRIRHYTESNRSAGSQYEMNQT